MGGLLLVNCSSGIADCLVLSRQMHSSGSYRLASADYWGHGIDVHWRRDMRFVNGAMDRESETLFAATT
jgi:hypothetical protein